MTAMSCRYVHFDFHRVCGHIHFERLSQLYDQIKDYLQKHKYAAR
jgi:phosphatidylinositol 4-phosphatase